MSQSIMSVVSLFFEKFISFLDTFIYRKFWSVLIREYYFEVALKILGQSVESIKIFILSLLYYLCELFYFFSFCGGRRGQRIGPYRLSTHNSYGLVGRHRTWDLNLRTMTWHSRFLTARLIYGPARIMVHILLSPNAFYIHQAVQRTRNMCNADLELYTISHIISGYFKSF